MKNSKRGFLKSISRAFIFAVLLIIQAHTLIAQTSDTLTTYFKSDTTLYGSLTISLNNQFDSLYVIVNKKFSKPFNIKNKETIHLPEGEYNLTLATKHVQDISFPVTIIAHQQDTVHIPVRIQNDRKKYRENSSYPVLQRGINAEIFTDVDSRVIINDSTYSYGNTRLMLKKGKYRVITIHPDAGRSTKEISIKENPPRFHKLELYNKPNVWTVRMASLVPGGGQFVKKERMKAGIMAVGFVAGALVGFHYNKLLKKREIEYENAFEEYLLTKNETEALRLGNQADKIYNLAEKAQRRRNIIIGSLGAIYLYNLLDGWLNPPEGGYRNTDNRKAGVQPFFGTQNAGLKFKIQF